MHTVKTILAARQALALLGRRLRVRIEPNRHDHHAAAQSPQTFASAATSTPRACAATASRTSPTQGHNQRESAGRSARCCRQAVGDSPQFNAAQKACQGIVPGLQNGSPGATGRTRSRPTRRTCWRSRSACAATGLQGFPDPTAQGQLTLEMIAGRRASTSSAPSVLTAAKACVGVTHGAITLAQVEQAIHNSQ